VWKNSFEEELGTVPAEPVIKAARRAHRECPNKRLIVHILQPHCPFISEDRDGEYANNVSKPPDKRNSRPDHIWHDLMHGNVTLESAIKAYGETLRIGWEAAKPLLEELNGRTVVTSDHGNMYGERPWPYLLPLYAHPTGIRPDELVRIPWAVIEADDERPEIVDEGVEATLQDGEIDKQTLQNQLEALGYR
jgi:hypothetical protein